MFVVIHTDCIGSCKSNYHTITTTIIGTESSVRLVDVDGDGLLDIITGLAMGREITTMIDESSMDKFCHKLGNYL
jgi:hypothetical protein